MNAFELLQGQLAALTQRMRKLEVLFESLATPDQRDAAEVAAEHGFSVDVVLIPPTPGSRTGSKNKRAIARALHQKKWTVPRIARALKSCERTVRRWIA